MVLNHTVSMQKFLVCYITVYDLFCIQIYNELQKIYRGQISPRPPRPWPTVNGKWPMVTRQPKAIFGLGLAAVHISANFQIIFPNV